MLNLLEKENDGKGSANDTSWVVRICAVVNHITIGMCSVCWSFVFDKFLQIIFNNLILIDAKSLRNLYLLNNYFLCKF